MHRYSHDVRLGPARACDLTPRGSRGVLLPAPISRHRYVASTLQQLHGLEVWAACIHCPGRLCRAGRVSAAVTGLQGSFSGHTRSSCSGQCWPGRPKPPLPLRRTVQGLVKALGAYRRYLSRYVDYSGFSSEILDACCSKNGSQRVVTGWWFIRLHVGYLCLHVLNYPIFALVQ